MRQETGKRKSDKYIPELRNKPILNKQLTAKFIFGRSNKEKKHSPQSKRSSGREPKMELYNSGNKTVEQSEMNRIIIKAQIPKSENESIKIILQSNSDLFFYYTAEFRSSDMVTFNHKYQMEIGDLAEFALMFEKNVEEVMGKKKSVEFVVEEKDKIVMTIYQEINGKEFIVFDIEFEKVQEDEARENAAFRYGSLRDDIMTLQNRINEVKDLVKAKNPYLLTFLNKL